MMPSCLRLFNIRRSRPALCRRRLVFFRNIGPVLCLKNVALDMSWRGTQRFEKLLCVLMVRNKTIVLNMSEVLADEPCSGVPRAPLAFSGKPLNAAGFADILIPKSHEFTFGPNLDTVKVALASGPGPFAISALRLRPRVFGAGHFCPCFLRLLYISPGRRYLFCSYHYYLLTAPFDQDKCPPVVPGWLAA